MSRDLRGPIKLRGRVFSQDEISRIRAIVERSPGEHRFALSKTICEELDWRQDNGRLKDRSCRDVLLKLSEAGLLRLPERRQPPRRRRPIPITSKTDPRLPPSVGPRDIDVHSFSILTASGCRSDERLWNEFVERYHYLGYGVPVGPHIKYLVHLGRRAHRLHRLQRRCVEGCAQGLVDRMVSCRTRTQPPPHRQQQPVPDAAVDTDRQPGLQDSRARPSASPRRLASTLRLSSCSRRDLRSRRSSPWNLLSGRWLDLHRPHQGQRQDGSLQGRRATEEGRLPSVARSRRSATAHRNAEQCRPLNGYLRRTAGGRRGALGFGSGHCSG